MVILIYDTADSVKMRTAINIKLLAESICLLQYPCKSIICLIYSTE